jgi:NAD(P)-dependent dehydrogenase (short-subunit alcohol dehydrogenase family)
MAEVNQMAKINPLLQDKIVVLVGGAGLLGKAFGEELLRNGATLVVADVDAVRCRAACDELAEKVTGATMVAETVNITSRESLDSLIERVNSQYGRVDAVVNNAYPRNDHYGRKLEQVEYDDFCENVSTHLGGYFLSTQRFAEFFKCQGFGHVVNISSIYGSVAPRFDVYEDTPMTMPVEYAAIKSAIQHLSLYFMRYYKGTRLRFNVLSPGGIFDNQPASFLQRYKQYAQHKGMLAPADIAGTLVYLISDLSSYVNGENIIVDDGWSK